MHVRHFFDTHSTVESSTGRSWMPIEAYDYKSLTLDVATAFCRIKCDAFREDIVYKSFMRPDELFTDDALPPIVEFEKLKTRVNLFEKSVISLARDLYSSVKSDPRQRVFLMKDANGIYVAGVRWALPKYIDLPRLSIFERLRNWFTRNWFNLLHFFMYLRHRDPIKDSGLQQEFSAARRDVGLVDSPERREELKSLDLKQLKETTYPQDLCYFLNPVVVRSDSFGKGYGKVLVKESLEALGPYQAPPMLVGPAKAALLSAPTARGFYTSAGFSIGAVTERPLAGGEFVPYTLFFLNLHSDD